ncbi:MAG TPA: hypothetical protein VIU62_20720 [Chloroflexota bacterium]
MTTWPSIVTVTGALASRPVTGKLYRKPAVTVPGSPEIGGQGGGEDGGGGLEPDPVTGPHIPVMVLQLNPPQQSASVLHGPPAPEQQTPPLQVWPSGQPQAPLVQQPPSGHAVTATQDPLSQHSPALPQLTQLPSG